MSTAVNVTESSFAEDVLSSDKTVLVDFWAEWCGPCRLVGPILDQIAAENTEKITIVKVNVDENPSLAAKYRITNIPAMKVFKGGEVVDTFIGAQPKVALEQKLAPYLS
ncbi:thioredoxin [Klugiella xanthotipulae]|uniref:Thioredoxin n=1 Tax=Klugiella xanthotipulae TaxID=244735 RepID=A0A543I6X4_9MICO|nr:thioredoxin [Klugiella xanthotipulae]TQM66305.1 thioredoxin [Klugiella xanthotipulae]